MIWRLSSEDAQPLTATDLASEQLMESHIEDWIEQNPALLEEQLMVIGRQVPIAAVGDHIDLLAVDPHGKLVVIELKRGTAGGDERSNWDRCSYRDEEIMQPGVW